MGPRHLGLWAASGMRLLLPALCTCGMQGASGSHGPWSSGLRAHPHPAGFMGREVGSPLAPGPTRGTPSLVWLLRAAILESWLAGSPQNTLQRGGALGAGLSAPSHVGQAGPVRPREGLGTCLGPEGLRRAWGWCHLRSQPPYTPRHSPHSPGATRAPPLGFQLVCQPGPPTPARVLLQARGAGAGGSFGEPQPTQRAAPLPPPPHPRTPRTHTQCWSSARPRRDGDAASRLPRRTPATEPLTELK